MKLQIVHYNENLKIYLSNEVQYITDLRQPRLSFENFKQISKEPLHRYAIYQIIRKLLQLRAVTGIVYCTTVKDVLMLSEVCKLTNIEYGLYYGYINKMNLKNS